MVGGGINNRTPDLYRKAFFTLDSWYTYRTEVFKSMYGVGPRYRPFRSSYCNKYEVYEVTLIQSEVIQIRSATHTLRREKICSLLPTTQVGTLKSWSQPENLCLEHEVSGSSKIGTDKIIIIIIIILFSIRRCCICNSAAFHAGPDLP